MPLTSSSTSGLPPPCLLIPFLRALGQHAVRQGKRYEQEQESLTHKARSRKQDRRRASKPASPISHEEVVGNHDCKKHKSKIERAHATPGPPVVKAAIAGYQHQAACGEIEDRNHQPCLQQSDLHDRPIQRELIEKQ